jgi:hypothetical protein
MERSIVACASQQPTSIVFRQAQIRLVHRVIASLLL